MTLKLLPRRIREMFASLALLACALPESASASSPLVVQTASGFVRGQEMDRVQSFKGIPYAAPPVGPLRWRPPQPAKPWREVFEANAFGHDCMQRSTSVMARGTSEPSEDCLVLNVFRPNEAQHPLPVLFYIHGGAFIQGAASAIVYDGSELARHGAIVVTINYRLGRFGFFAHPALTADQPGELKGNYGYMDQVAALTWVKDNIAAFGGDPKNVTIFGESAGGVSVSALLSSPLAAGLFNKAIIQSAPYRTLSMRRVSSPYKGQRSLEDFGIAFAKSQGILGAGSDALAQLRALPAEKIVDLSAGLPEMPETAVKSWGGPVMDGQLLPAVDADYFTLGQFTRVPIMIGGTSDDSPLPPESGDPLAKFGTERDRAIRTYDPFGTNDPPTIARKMAMDEIVFEPARHVASAAVKAGQPAYVYRFDYVTEGLRDRWALGAPHAAELAYVFDNIAMYYGPVGSTLDRSVAATMAGYWVNFAATGDPNGPGLATWPRYEPATDIILVFRRDGSVRAGPDPLKNRLDLAQSLADR